MAFWHSPKPTTRRTKNSCPNDRLFAHTRIPKDSLLLAGRQGGIVRALSPSVELFKVLSRFAENVFSVKVIAIART